MEDFYIDLSKAEIEVAKEEIPVSSSKGKLFILVSIFILISVILVSYILIEVSNNKVLSPLQKALNTKNLSSIAFTNQKIVKEKSKKEVIGFLPSWSVAQKVAVDLKALTQLIYFGLGVNSNGDLVMYQEDNIPVLEWQYFTSEYFTNIREQASNENVKVLVSIKNFDNENIDNLISNAVSTENFIKNLIVIIKKYNLDGVNLDFEYVTDSSFPTSKYFNNFLTKVSEGIKKENPKFILSVDVNATAVVKDSAYDMVKIGEIADFVILMGYDYRTVNSSFSGPVSPLFSKESEESIEQSIKSMSGRVPSNKIILAVPFYGYEWQTLSKAYKSPVVENTGALATYKRVKELIENRDDVELSWDDISQTPWLSYIQSGAIKQIYFEDEKSLSEKLKFINSQKLAGIGIWALGYEGEYKDLWNIISK